MVKIVGSSIFCFSLQCLKSRLSHILKKKVLGLYETLTLSQTTNFGLFQVKKIADNNFEFDKMARKLSKWVENTGEKEKLLVKSNFSFSHSVFKRYILQTRKNQGLFGKGLSVNANVQSTKELDLPGFTL